MSNKPQLIALLNAYSDGKSGGDVIFVEMAKRIKDYHLMVITSLLGKRFCQESGVRGRYLITTKEKEFTHVIYTYWQRAVKALFLRPKVKEKDIILATSDFLPDVLPAFYLKLSNKKATWIQKIFHLIPASRPLSFLAQRLSFFLIKKGADLVIVDHELVKEELIELNFDPQKIFVNPPGINLKYLKKIKPACLDGYEGIFMAQLRPSKGIFELIKIWRFVCQKKPSARLGIIGKGDKKIIRQLREEIEKEGLKNNITLLGFLPDKTAFGVIKLSKVFVFPSFEEGFGMAALEAQALGLPVVAWDLPCFAKVFKKGMIKVKAGDLEKFSQEILKLLTNRKFYQKLTKEAVNNAQVYSLEEAIKKELWVIEKRRKK